MSIATPTRESWLTERASVIGASETASILGIGYESAAAVWARKIGCEVSKEQTDAMRIGLVLQPAIIELARQDLNLPIVEEPAWTLRRSAELPFVGASLDGYIPAERDIPIDTKNVDRIHERKWKDEPPMRYQVQLQQQMLITGADHGYLFALIGGNKTVSHRVERNDRFIEKMLVMLRWFWDCVQSRKMPPNDNAHDQADVLSALYPRSNGTAIRLGEDAARIVEQREFVAQQIKELQSSEEAHKNALRLMLGDNAYGALPDGRWVSWKTQQRAGYYVEPGESRVMRFHKSRPKDAPALEHEVTPPEYLEVDDKPAEVSDAYGDRLIEAEAGFVAIGAVVRHRSVSGSRYLILRDNTHVRISDHEPNRKTAEWIEKHHVISIRVDQPNWRTVIDSLTPTESVQHLEL